MAEQIQIIPQERLGLWTSVAFIIALLALVLSSVSLYRIQHTAAITQIEFLALNKQVQDLKKQNVAGTAAKTAVQGALHK